MAIAPEPRYEVTMVCGDTDSSNHEWKLGGYKKCSHCDAMRLVVAVRDTQTATVAVATTPDTPMQTVRDTAYGYASAYGYAAQQLEIVGKYCRTYITPEYELGNPALCELARHVALLAERGTAEANDALRRYDASIVSLDSRETH